MGAYTIASDNALHEKVIWHANGRKLSVENFDGENVDKLIKIRQIRQYFPHQNFAPCSTTMLNDIFFKFKWTLFPKNR